MAAYPIRKERWALLPRSRQDEYPIISDMSHDHHSCIRLFRRRWDEEDARRGELEAQATLDCHLLPKTKTGSQAIDREAMSRAGLFGKSPSAFAVLAKSLFLTGTASVRLMLPASAELSFRIPVLPPSQQE
jgi:hypothetical protein